MVLETASHVHVVDPAAVCSKVLRLLAVLLVASRLLLTMGPVGGVEARPAPPAVAGGDAVEVRRTAERDAFLRELRMRGDIVYHPVALTDVQQQPSSIVLEVLRRQRRAAAVVVSSTVAPSETWKGFYGSNSYWNRGGWGGGYGKK